MRRNGRLIEVQLRTVLQDAWANQVEDDSRRLATGYKFGRGGEAKVRDFGTDYDVALEAYAEIEGEMRGRDDLDIVLVDADSLETVTRTHSSYFDTAETFESLLPAGVLSR